MQRRALLSAAAAGLAASACASPRSRGAALGRASSAARAGRTGARRPAVPGGRVVRASELLADAAILRRAYEALHPGLYRYNTPAQMNARFDALGRSLARDQSLQEAFVAFTAFTAGVRCGHSYPNFFNQPGEVATSILASQPCLPFYFRWLGGGMVVTRSFAEGAPLAPGDRVLAIDGVPVDEVLATLLPLARADGANDAKRVNYLEARGDSTYEAFDVLYAMHFPPRGGRVELVVEGPRPGGRRALAVRTLSHDERVAPVRAREEGRKGGDAPQWRLAFAGDEIATLTMPTWALFQSTWDWRRFLDESFEVLTRRRIPELVIDLRGNEGGLSVGDTLLSHLVAREVAPGGYRRLVRYRKVPAELDPHLDTWDDSFRDWGAAAVDAGGGFYRLTRYDDDARGSVVKPARPTYRGRTWVLVDASNSSATFEFAYAVQRQKLGTLVGQPTGGNLRGINGGAFFFLRLPNSKIEIDVPLIGQFPDGERPDAGLVPDVAVTPTTADVAAGVDAELAAVRAAKGG